jgi:hypothetical protein
MSESMQSAQVNKANFLKTFQDIRSEHEILDFDRSTGSPFRGEIRFDPYGSYITVHPHYSELGGENHAKFKWYTPCKITYQTENDNIAPLMNGPFSVAKSLLANKGNLTSRTNIVSDDWLFGRFSFIFDMPVQVGGYKSVTAIHLDYDASVVEWDFPHPTPAKLVWHGSHGNVHVTDENGELDTHGIDGVYFTVGQDNAMHRDVFPYGCESHQVFHRLKECFGQASERINYQSELHFYFDKPRTLCGVSNVSGVHFMYGDTQDARPKDIYRRTFDSDSGGSGQAAVSMGQADEGDQANHKRKLDQITETEEDKEQAGVSVKDEEPFVATMEWAVNGAEEIIQGILDKFPGITRDALESGTAFSGLKLKIRVSTKAPKVYVYGRAPVNTMRTYLKETDKVNWLHFRYEKDIHLATNIEDEGNGGSSGDVPVVVQDRPALTYDQVSLTEQEYIFRQGGEYPRHINVLLHEVLRLLRCHAQIDLCDQGE